MLVSPVPPFFFLTHYVYIISWMEALCIIISFLVIYSICLSLPSSISKTISSILLGGHKPGFYLFDEISAADLFWEALLFICDIIFFFFFHLCLFDYVHFQYSQVFVIFFFPKCSDSFLIWQFYSFNYLSCSISHIEHGTFWYGRFYPYILTSFSYCLYHSYPFLQTFWCFPCTFGG